MADEARGKFLYDMVAARVTAQGADQSALVGRAKDLLGVASITTTITGVLANDKITNVSKSDAAKVVFIIMAVALLSVVFCAFDALRPRTWYLSPDPLEAEQTLVANPIATVDQYYESIAEGFIQLDVAVTGKSALQHNEDQISHLRTLVRVEIIALGVLAGCGLALAIDAVF